MKITHCDHVKSVFRAKNESENENGDLSDRGRWGRVGRLASVEKREMREKKDLKSHVKNGLPVGRHGYALYLVYHGNHHDCHLWMRGKDGRGNELEIR